MRSRRLANLHCVLRCTNDQSPIATTVRIVPVYPSEGKSYCVDGRLSFHLMRRMMRRNERGDQYPTARSLDPTSRSLVAGRFRRETATLVLGIALAERSKPFGTDQRKEIGG